MNEEWRPIPGYEGRYEVSDKGQVRSLNYRRTHETRLLVGVPRPRQGGYLHYGLSTQGRLRFYYPHSLVMLAFVGPRPAGLEVRHLDGNPRNNVLANLRYGTRSENALDREMHRRMRALAAAP